MVVLLLFAFLSGLVTIAAPCIWPLLPIVLSTSATGGHRKPLGVTLGIITSFAFFTLTLSYIVSVIPVDPDLLRLFAVVVIAFFGLTLIVPSLSRVVEGAVSRLSGKFAGIGKSRGDGFASGFITGAALGIVWTPCAGPILATIATLAATQSLNIAIVAVTVSYVIGVGIPLFAFALLGQHIVARSRGVSKYTGRIQQVFGVVMIITAVFILTGFDRFLQARLLDAFPSYSNFLTKLESNDAVTKQLDALRDRDQTQAGIREGAPINMLDMPKDQYSTAPEFVGISKWLNVQRPLTMKELRGKVVLIDFWTYTCINCIRTLPYVTRWHEKYKDDGLVIIGVHTPEFEFEKKTENVENANRQYKITYPVAQDNDFATWRAYDNHYWPAKYLIDAEGRIRYSHFGEGNYKETERFIQELLKEAGKQADQATIDEPAQPARFRQTPETYLGSLRADPASPVNYSPNMKREPEYLESGPGGSKIELKFYASKVFLVITPPPGGGEVAVMLDGQNIPAAQSGADVKDGIITLDVPRLYEIVDLKDEPGDHTLILRFDAQGTKAFAFTFG